MKVFFDDSLPSSEDKALNFRRNPLRVLNDRFDSTDLRVSNFVSSLFKSLFFLHQTSSVSVIDRQLALRNTQE